MPEPKVLLSGLGIPESPRWHEGRLWFCNRVDRQVVAVGLDGRAEVMYVRDPDTHPMGYSIDWLPDGRLLVTGDKLRRQEPVGGSAAARRHRRCLAVPDQRALRVVERHGAAGCLLRRPDPAVAPPRGTLVAITACVEPGEWSGRGRTTPTPTPASPSVRM